MTDLAALVTALETDPKYDTNVRGGHNGRLVTMLNAEDVGLPKRLKAIPAEDFVAAITSETLTADQHERIRTYLATGNFPIHKSAVRAWLQAQGLSTAAMTAIDSLSQVAGKLADEFLEDGEFLISLNDVRAAVAQVSKSAISQYYR